MDDNTAWQQLISDAWSLDAARQRLEHPATQYPGRPVLLTASEVKNLRLFDFSDQLVRVNFAGHELQLDANHFYSLVASTHAKLQENLAVSDGPVAAYLQAEFARFAALRDPRDYGFYAFYFTRSGEFEAVVQFPELPTYKLALTCSASQLLQDKKYQRSWLQNRCLLARAHVLVAGASVASATAENLIRDGRIGHLTIGDPKAPNATNFNRTNYDVVDVGSGETKALSFARKIHRQDPTQVIYLARDGFGRDNILEFLGGRADAVPVDVAVEAVDNLDVKLAFGELAGQAHVPLVQVSDVGSIAQLTFQDARARERGESLVFGLPDVRLQQLLQQDFIQVAAHIVGLENAIKDEMGRFVAGQKNTPFGVATPQLGSTAAVAAGVASEKILRFLLDREQQPDFPYRRVTIDKKNNRCRAYHHPSVQEKILGWLFALKSRRARE